MLISTPRPAGPDRDTFRTVPGRPAWPLLVLPHSVTKPYSSNCSTRDDTAARVSPTCAAIPARVASPASWTALRTRLRLCRLTVALSAFGSRGVRLFIMVRRAYATGIRALTRDGTGAGRAAGEDTALPLPRARA